MSKFKYMIENGTKKDWKMIQEKYPDMWAFMTKVKYDEDDTIVHFNLLEIVPWEKLGETTRKYLGKVDGRLYFIRTTYADEYTNMGVD